MTPTTRDLAPKTLFVPGYCALAEDDLPDLSLRIFSHDGAEVFYGFTSMASMRRYFNDSGLQKMKYLKLRGPDHLEVFAESQMGVVIDPGSPDEVHLAPEDLAPYLHRREIPDLSLM